MKRIGFVVIISFILVSIIIIIATINMSKDFTFEDDNGTEVEDNQINFAQNLIKKKELTLYSYNVKSPSQISLFSLKGASTISISLPKNIIGLFSIS